MRDLMRELLEEVAVRPIAFAAEVVQSLLLMVVLVWAGRRYAARALGKRHEQIAAALAQAANDAEQSVKLREEALAVLQNAATASADIVRQAQESAAQERTSSVSETDTASREMVAKAQNTVAAEKDHIRRAAADQLVRLTSDIARRYVDEFLTDAERRALTRTAIEVALQRLAPTAGAAGREQ